MITSIVIILLVLGITLLLPKLIRIFVPPKHLRHLKRTNFFKVLFGLLFSHLPGPYLQARARQKYGRIYCQYVDTWVVMIHDDEAAIKQILKHPEIFEKHQGDDIQSQSAQMFFGKNIVSENGENWHRLRRICNPAFHWEYLQSFIERFTVSSEKVFEYIENHPSILQTTPKAMSLLSTEQMMEEGKKYTTVEVVPLMQKLTLDVLGDCAFSANFGSFDDSGEYVTIYNRIVKKLFQPLNFFFKHYDKVPIASNRQLKKDIVRFEQLLQAVIQQRREELETGVQLSRKPDLLDMMIQNEGGMTDAELRYNFNIFFLAGHDTTSTTLSMALNQLAMHPEIQDRAREEARRVLAGKSSPTYEETKELTYITQIIKETLRLWPPVSILPARVASTDAEVGGHTYPKGTIFAICIYNLHHSAEYWENPNVFDPDRFAPNKKISPYTWLPFGIGPRVCIGNNFSIQEQRVFLAMLLLKYKVHPGPVLLNKQTKLTGLNFELLPINFLLPSNLFLRFERL